MQSPPTVRTPLDFPERAGGDCAAHEGSIHAAVSPEELISVVEQAGYTAAIPRTGAPGGEPQPPASRAARIRKQAAARK
jgi:hypothetical protein